MLVLNGFAVQSLSLGLMTRQDVLPLGILREYMLIPLKVSNTCTGRTNISEFLNTRSHLLVIKERNLASEVHPSKAACHRVYHLCDIVFRGSW